ncbi:MAG: hypothetical protein CVV06_09065 [Gammaproteobacteria bacterium HGW-Gammaproteobacteria-10]|nr:MAG: hypothetical protein CVV06_09065 [Gammaproteobacteria bacterium HGW-Gammaproteobacteria-10]
MAIALRSLMVSAAEISAVEVVCFIAGSSKNAHIRKMHTPIQRAAKNVAIEILCSSDKLRIERIIPPFILKKWLTL